MKYILLLLCLTGCSNQPTYSNYNCYQVVGPHEMRQYTSAEKAAEQINYEGGGVKYFENLRYSIKCYRTIEIGK